MGQNLTHRFARCGDLRAHRHSAVDLNLCQTFAQLGFVFHTGGDLLADIAALAEINAVETLKAHFKDIAVGRELNAGFRDHMRHPDCIPVAAILARHIAIKTPAQGRVARVRQGACGGLPGAAPHLQVGLVDGDIGAQLIHLEPLQKVICQIIGHIQQHRLALGGEKEIREVFALRGQDRRIDQTVF